MVEIIQSLLSSHYPYLTRTKPPATRITVVTNLRPHGLVPRKASQPPLNFLVNYLGAKSPTKREKNLMETN